MGQSSSSSHGAEPTLQNPFPVTPHLSSDLDRLSFVAARILNTPDIYNIENLSKMDVCGSYTVFLKQKIKDDLLHSYGRTLKPLSVKTEGEKIEEIVYQDGSTIDKETREKICGDLADTMVQVISIVVATLASIQVASPSREVVMHQASPPAATAESSGHKGGGEQTGGAADDERTTLLVISQLGKLGYIQAIADESKVTTPRELLDPTYQRGPNLPKIYIAFTTNRLGKITENFSSLQFYAYIIQQHLQQTHAFRFVCSQPININEGVGFAIQIMDGRGLIQTAGILTKNEFTTFNNKKWRFLELITGLFMRMAGTVSSMSLETSDVMKTYEETFKVFTQINPTQAQFKQKEEIIRKLFPEQPQLPPGYPPPGYPGYPGYPPFVQPQQKRFETIGVMSPLMFSRPAAPTVSISAPGQRVINQLRHFNNLIPKNSSPAAVRAITLAGILDASRAVNTNVCNDPYWASPNLSTIYPWATLQFLSLKAITAKTEKGTPRIISGDSKKSLVDTSRYEFESEWDSIFITGLKGLYSSAPKLKISEKTSGFVLPPAAPAVAPAAAAAAAAVAPAAPAAAGVATLERMKFESVNDLEIDKVACKTSPTPRVQYREVQEAIHHLHHLYNTHVENVWRLLNSLILVIQDPESKKELVRLHPLAVSQGEASIDYVKKKGQEARKMLAEFYVEVEKTYLHAIKELKAV